METLYQKLAGGTVMSTLKDLEKDIRARPADADLRAAFVQFLCLSGNWERALTQLQSWSALKPQAQPSVTLLERALQGERQRTLVMAGQSRPQMPDNQWPWLTQLASALGADAETAQRQRLAAFERADVNPGELIAEQGASHSFDWLMDGDARFGPVCEVIVNGGYFWLPFSAIAEIRFQPPTSVTDLVWRHALVRLTDGSEQLCQIPARYPLTAATEDCFLLGQTTEWRALDDQGALYLGLGQKVWLHEGAEFPLLTLEMVSFR